MRTILQKLHRHTRLKLFGRNPWLYGQQAILFRTLALPFKATESPFPVDYMTVVELVQPEELSHFFYYCI